MLLTVLLTSSFSGLGLGLRARFFSFLPPAARSRAYLWNSPMDRCVRTSFGSRMMSSICFLILAISFSCDALFLADSSLASFRLRDSILLCGHRGIPSFMFTTLSVESEIPSLRAASAMGTWNCEATWANVSDPALEDGDDILLLL